MSTRFKLIGDHSRQHSGSEATAKQLRRLLLASGRITEDDNYDVMVINGQGSMHHAHPHCRAKLRAARRALEQKKRVWLVNSDWQAVRAVEKELLQGFERIIVRDVLSQKELDQNYGIDSEVALDLCYFADIEREGPITDLRGEIAITDFYSTEFDCHVRVVGGELRHFEYLALDQMPWPQLVRSLKTCELLITGRLHGVYAACKAGVPFVALRAESHKIEGLISTAGIEIPICQHAREIPGAIAWARRNHDKYLELFAWMNSQQSWCVSDENDRVRPSVLNDEGATRPLWQKIRRSLSNT